MASKARKPQIAQMLVNGKLGWYITDYDKSAVPLEATYDNLKLYWKEVAKQTLYTKEDYTKFVEWFLEVKPESLEKQVYMASDTAHDFVQITRNGSSLYGGDQTDFATLLTAKLKEKSLPKETQTALEKEQKRCEKEYQNISYEQSYLEIEEELLKIWEKNCQNGVSLESPQSANIPNSANISEEVYSRLKQLYANTISLNNQAEYVDMLIVKNNNLQTANKENIYYSSQGDVGAVLNTVACGYVATANVTAYEALKKNGNEYLYSGKGSEPYDYELFFVHMCNVAAFFVPSPSGVLSGLSNLMDFLSSGVKKYCNNRGFTPTKYTHDNIDNHLKSIGFAVYCLEQDMPVIVGGLNLGILGPKVDFHGNVNKHFVTITEVKFLSGPNRQVEFRFSTWGKSISTNAKDFTQNMFISMRAYKYTASKSTTGSGSSTTLKKSSKNPVTPAVDRRQNNE